MAPTLLTTKYYGHQPRIPLYLGNTGFHSKLRDWPSCHFWWIYLVSQGKCEIMFKTNHKYLYPHPAHYHFRHSPIWCPIALWKQKLNKPQQNQTTLTDVSRQLWSSKWRPPIHFIKDQQYISTSKIILHLPRCIALCFIKLFLNLGQKLQKYMQWLF